MACIILLEKLGIFHDNLITQILSLRAAVFFFLLAYMDSGL